MSSDNQVRVDIYGDASSLSAAAKSAIASMEAVSAEAKRVSASLEQSGATDAQVKFISELKRKYDLIGKSSAEIAVYEASMKGMTGADLEAVHAMATKIDKLEKQEAMLGRVSTMAGIAGAAIGGFLVKSLLDSVKAAEAAEQAHLRLEATLKATGYSAGMTIGEMDALAESMKSVTGFDDDLLRESMAVLLTFRNVSRAQFGDVMMAAADLSRLMGQDLKSSVLQLGKALEDPEQGLTALRRSGVSFSQEQINVIKSLYDTGRQAEAIGIILQTLRDQGINGIATAMNTGLFKATNDTKMAWDDLLKAIGQTEQTGGRAERVLQSLTEHLVAMRNVINEGTWSEKLRFFLLGNESERLGALRAGQPAPSQSGSQASVREVDNAMAGRAAKEAADAQARLNQAQQEFLGLMQKLSGVTPEFYSQLNILKSAYDRGEMSLTEFRKAAAQLMETQGFAQQKAQESARVFEDAAVQQARAYAQQYEAAVKLARGIELEATAGHKLLPVEAALAQARVTLTAAQAQELEKLLAGALLIEKRTAAEREAAEVAQIHAEYVKANLDPLDRQIEALEREIEFYGMTKGAIQRAIVTRLEEARALAAANGAWPEHLAYLDAEIEKRQRLAAAADSKDALDANKRATEQMQRDWEKMHDQLSQSLTDALMDGGMDAGEALRRYFRTLVLRPIIQGTVDAGLSAIGFGGGSSGGNLLSAGSNAYSLFSPDSMLSSGYNAFATSSFGASLGLSEAAVLSTPEAFLAGAPNMLSSGGLTSLGTALPYIAAALAVASLLMEDGGGPKTEGGLVRTIGGGTAELSSTGQKFFTGDGADAAVAAILDPLADGIAEWARKLGGDASGLEIGLGFNSDPQGTAGDSVGGGVYRNGEELYFRAFGGYGRGTYQQELVAETNRLMLAALESLDLNDLADAYLDGLDIAGLSADAAAQAVGFLQATQQLVDAFGVLGIGADAVTTELLAMMGGVDAAVSALNGYYQTYYSEQERNAILTGQLADRFADLNLAMPATKDEFRALVESLDLTTTGGQEAYAALMGMAPAFATVADAAEQSAQAMEQSAQAMEQAAEEARTAMKTLYDDLIGGLRAAVETAWAGVETSFGQAMEDRTAEYDAAIATLDAAAQAAQATYDAAALRAENERKAAQAAYETQIAALDAAARAIDARIEAERTRYDDDRDALQTLLDDLTDPIRDAGDAVSRLERLTGSLADTLDGLRIQGSEREYRADAQAQIRNALAVARATGTLPDADALQSALSTVSQPSQDLFATFEDYARDFYRTAIDIRDLNDLSQGALDTARSEYDVLVSLESSYRQQLDALATAHETALESLDLQRESLDLQRELAASDRDDRIDAADTALENARIAYDRIVEAADRERAALTDAYEMDMQVFEDQLAAQRDIYEAALGIDSSVLGVQDAIAALATAVNALSLQPNTPNVPTSVAPVYDRWQTSGNVQAFASSTGAGAVQAIGNTDPTGIVWTDATGQNSATQAVLTQAATDLLNAGRYDDLLSRADTIGLSDAALSQITGVATETIDAWRDEMITLANGWSGTKAEMRDIVLAEYAAGRMTETDLYLGARDLGLTSALLDEIMEWPLGTTASYGALHNLPAFAAGTNFVPADMVAQVHAGERIIPAADNAALFAMLNDGNRRDEALVNEIKALRAEVTRLREENRAAQTSIATNTRKSAQALEQWDADGMPEVRT